MNKYTAGLAAGFIATVALSAVMIMKAALGMMPGLDVPAMLGALSGTGVAGGWVIHFAIGTILWGLIFAALIESIPGGTPLTRGLVFSVGAWLLMMIVLMPIAGKGLFAMNMGIAAAVATLVLHLIYGAVLGWTYGKMAPVHPHAAA